MELEELTCVDPTFNAFHFATAVDHQDTTNETYIPHETFNYTQHSHNINSCLFRLFLA